MFSWLFTCALRDNKISASATYSTYVASDWEQSIDTKNRKEQLSSQCAQTFQVEADCLGKSDAYLHTHTDIYTHIYMICKWSKVVNPVIFRYRRLIPGWASKGSLIVPGISTFPWLLGWSVPWLGYAGLQAPPRTASLSLSPSPCRWPLGAPKFSQDFLGREPSKIPAFRSSCSFCNRLMGSRNLGFDSTTGDAMMRCDEMWWGMPGLLDFLILFVALECFRSGVTSDFGVSIWSIWVGHLPMVTGLPKLRWPLGLLGLGSRFVGRRPHMSHGHPIHNTYNGYMVIILTNGYYMSIIIRIQK